MKALVLVAVLVAAPGAAHADDTFEARAQGAQAIAHVDDVVWAVTAKCDAGDDTQQRQCRAVRDEAAKRYAGAMLLVEADPTGFEVGAWNPQKRSVAIKLAGCVACAGVAIDGKPWRVAGASAARLYDNAKTFADEAAAIAFIKTVRKVRVQMLVKLPAKPRAERDTLTVEIAGYRVVTPCDGQVVIASPPSSPIAADHKACVPAPPAHP